MSKYEIAQRPEIVSNYSVATPENKETKCTENSKGNLGQRYNNPLNIKHGGKSKKWVDEGKAEIGVNKFLKFKCEEDGFQAARDLLKEAYSNISLEKAMRKWSGGGYGVITEFDKPVNEMTEKEFDKLVEVMANREGYYAHK